MNKNDRTKNNLSLRLFPALRTFAALLLAFIFILCQESSTAAVKDQHKVWVGTWGTAEQLVEPYNMPPQPGLSSNTLRQIVRVSIGSDSLRIRFSNEFSTSPVTMKSVHIAVSEGNGLINTAADKEILFDGKPDVTMAPGTAVTSDPLGFDLKPESDIAITIYFGETSPDVTGHPGSRTTSYLLKGNEVSKADFSDAVKTDHWYVIEGIDVLAPKSSAAVVALGNSITDGRGSGTNKQDRWTDDLARRLQENSDTKHVAVLNMGIGGNCVLRKCLGPSAVSRFDRDVLNQNGVRWLIILEGINDIGGSRPEDSAKVASDLIAAYKNMIDSAHAKGIRVYGATMTPFGGSFYDKPGHEFAWKTVNDWIRNSGRFDAVIDFDAAMRDTKNPLHLSPGLDSGDHLHPNEKGYQVMANAIELNLFH